jgi:hypothetical protein
MRPRREGRPESIPLQQSLQHGPYDLEIAVLELLRLFYFKIQKWQSGGELYGRFQASRKLRPIEKGGEAHLR